MLLVVFHSFLFATVVLKAQGQTLFQYEQQPPATGDDLSPMIDLADLVEDGVDSYTIPPGEDSTINNEIIGGNQVFAGTYPWFTWLIELRSDFKFYSAGCGATLISREYVLTAAHCIKSNTKTQGYAWIGFLTTASGNGGQSSQAIKVRDVFVHPSYKSNTLDNDFALIRLSSSATATSPVQIDVNNLSESYPTGKKLMAMGMGCLNTSKTRFPTTLQHTELEYIKNDVCHSAPYRWSPTLNSKNKMCAGGGGTTAICNGDSGSAIYDSETRTVVGVASYVAASSPLLALAPPVFARISAQFFDWIQPTVCSNSNFSTKPSWCEANRNTNSPTNANTSTPTSSPTNANTSTPTTPPTNSPSKSPTNSPSKSPTENPSKSITMSPSKRPVVDPTIPPFPSPTPPTGTKTHSPTICKMNYELTLMTDRYGEEISWEIAYDETGEVVASSSTGGYPSLSTITESGCLPYNCYSFTIRDSFGDGLCCGHGNGSYSLTVNNNIVGKGGEFKTREKTLFGTCRPIH